MCIVSSVVWLLTPRGKELVSIVFSKGYLAPLIVTFFVRSDNEKTENVLPIGGVRESVSFCNKKTASFVPSNVTEMPFDFIVQRVCRLAML